MNETIFQKQILKKLDKLERDMKLIKENVISSKLTDKEKRAIDLALKEEKEGKLLSKELVFG